MKFLSEASVALHKEYLRDLKLKMSIFEKSYRDMEGATVGELVRSLAPRAEREAAILLKAEIIAHEIYFSSFGESNLPSHLIRTAYGSEAAFLYRLLCECRDADGGFLLLFRNKRGVDYCVGREYRVQLLKRNPVLALDLCEHAYFLDYGFGRDEYLKAALSSLNLSKIENCIEKSEK